MAGWAGADEPPGPLRSAFPKDFLWGAAVAAYQNEGDNFGSDLWNWERRQGWESSGKAANSWEMEDTDLALLKDLGVNAHRLSLEWGRIMPDPDRPDEAVLKHYEALLIRLRKAGIRPAVTLHHFTNPAWFWRRHPEGWKDPSAAEDFLAFAGLLAERFGKYVDHWMTFNEPMVYNFNGHVVGYFPPGERRPLSPLTGTLMPAVRTMTDAHRRAWKLIHAKDRWDADGDGTPARVGLVMNISLVQPLEDSPRHRAAAERWDHFFHWNMLDAAAGKGLDFDLDGKPEEMTEQTASTLDFIGINYYTRVFVRSLPLVLPPLEAFPFHAEVLTDPTGRLLWKLAGGRLGPGPKEDMGREIFPEGIALVSKEAWRRYGKPIMITENGLPDAKDALKTAYIRDHLAALQKAVQDGVPVLGYFHWTLVDNYEWGTWSQKTGLYRLDRENGWRRTPTAASSAYRDFLK